MADKIEDKAPETQSDGRYSTVELYLQRSIDPVRDIPDKWTQGWDALSDRRAAWADAKRHYNGYIKDKVRTKGRANFHFHKLFPVIETAAARFAISYFGNTPFVHVDPANARSVDSAPRMESTLQHFYDLAPEFYMSTMRLVKYTGLFGTGFRLPSWRREFRTVRREVPVVISGYQVGTEMQESEELVYEGLAFDVFDPTEIVIDPWARTLGEARWAIIQQYVPIETIVRRAESGVYDLGKVMDIPLNGSGQEEVEYQTRQKELGYTTPEMDEGMVRLQHLITPEKVQTVANQAVTIRDTKSWLDLPMMPFVQAIQTIDIDTPYPVSMAGVVLPNQKMSSVLVNTALDVVLQNAHHSWKYKQHIDPNYLISVPNQRIPVRQMDDVDVIQTPELKTDILAMKQMLDANLEEAIGYFGPQKGYSAQRQTATSDAIFQEEGGKRIMYDVMTFERTALVPEAKIAVALIQRYMPDTLEVAIHGGEGQMFEEFTRDMVNGQFNFRVSGASTAINRAVVQKQMIELYSISKDATQFVRMPEGQLVPVPVLDQYQALREMYQSIGHKSTDRILYRPEIFGIPLNNGILQQYGLPQVPGLDQMPVRPGSEGKMGQQPPRPNPRSNNVTDLGAVRSANQQPALRAV